MAATTDADADADAEEEDLTRPRFRGCVFCYGAEWIAYGVRRLRR
ncbi:hypothetical protein [Haloplanus halophilus]|nr:hypothetical protein [Haloplanus sp. GDY1]